MTEHTTNGSGPNGSVRAAGSRPGRRALFSEFDSTGDADAPTGAPTSGPAEGRRALFSEPAQVEPGHREAVVHCRTCLAATPLSLVGLARALVPSVWLPTRPWPRLMRCPACRRVSWCRIDWPGRG
ncbi:MAG TPA: hypothetical protein VG435_05570 [Acidimicrobiales bacterium]|jgi:hypothetical protein|nr:hypothetical protein [Acidimicrobiales bacterium]